MSSNADNFEPIVVLSDEHIDNPSEDELKLVLQFMPEIYQAFIQLIADDQETSTWR